MYAQSCRTSDVPQPQRRRHWESSISPYFGRLHADAAGAEGLDAQCDVYDMGGIAAIRMDIPRSRVTRLARDAADRGGAYFKLSMQLAGTATVSAGGETATLGVGDWVLLDQTRPYTWESPSPSSLFGLQIPRRHLAGMKLPGLVRSQRVESAACGMPGVLAGYLRVLEAQIAQVADKAAALLADTSVGLLAAALEDERGGVQQAGDSLAMLRVRASLFVRAHACDPELSVDDVAEALHCSRRHLFKAFSGEALSPEKMIWQTRLERSREALLDPRNADSLIATIAYDSGFNSDAHFTRTFKARYGLSPARYRTVHRAECAVG